jgi:predicted nucleotidyltransferase
MDKKQAIRLAQQYKHIVEQHFPLKAMYLFGSYSNGGYNDNSDIDIAVIVAHRSDNFFNDTPLLWTLKRKVSNLIEPILLTENDDSPLYSNIIRTGILI